MADKRPGNSVCRERKERWRAATSGRGTWIGHWRPHPTLLGLVAAFALLGIGLLEPTLTVNQPVYRVLLVLDITQSMNVIDRPSVGEPQSRLERAKSAALGAASTLPCGFELGLGLFTGHRTLVLFAPVEICANYNGVVDTVRSVDWRMAWEARSEVSKGLHSALRAARTLGDNTAVLFITDGHEAPPLHPRLRPRFSGAPGEVRGAVAGVGGDEPVPIPKLDVDGIQRGYWAADEVMQVNSYSLGRSGSVAGEALAGVNSDVEHGAARSICANWRRPCP